jgi:imidazoleglycerol phosphate synthase glutamine amidotransferase subunit HisH
MTTIIDFGLYNLRLIKNMLHRVGSTATTSAEHDANASASRVILSGVHRTDSRTQGLVERDTIALGRSRLRPGSPLLHLPNWVTTVPWP